MSHFFFLYWSPSSSLCTVFYSISSNIDEVLSINPSANVFFFRDFNICHKNWLTYLGGTDRPGALCYNFSILNDLTQMVNFPTRIPDCDSHSLALLDLFFSPKASTCSAMASPPLGNSDHVVVSVSIDFPSNSQQDAPSHRIAMTILVLTGMVLLIISEMFHGRISLKLVLLLLLVNFVSGFRMELRYISLMENRSSQVSGQVSLISMVFSCLCLC